MLCAMCGSDGRLPRDACSSSASSVDAMRVETPAGGAKHQPVIGTPGASLTTAIVRRVAGSPDDFALRTGVRRRHRTRCSRVTRATGNPASARLALGNAEYEPVDADAADDDWSSRSRPQPQTPSITRHLIGVSSPGREDSPSRRPDSHLIQLEMVGAGSLFTGSSRLTVGRRGKTVGAAIASGLSHRRSHSETRGADVEAESTSLYERLGGIYSIATVIDEATALPLQHPGSADHLRRSATASAGVGSPPRGERWQPATPSS